VIPPPVDSAPAAKANRAVVEPAPSVEEADIGGEPMADEDAPDERPGSSAQPDRQAETLKALNSKLVKEAVETRGQVAALTAQVDERSADAAALADLERHVLQAGLIVPFVAAGEYCTALRGHLVDAQEPLQAAKSRAAREADAREDATARLEVAEADNLRFVELLGRMDAEAASACKNVAGMEAVVSELAGNSTELCARKGDFEKQLGEMSASACSAHAQKAEVETSFSDYKMKAKMYQQEIQEKLDEKSKQLESLSSSKAEMEVKFQSLEAGLSAALANNWELESEVKTSMTELAEANRNLEKFRFEVADVGKKYTTVMAEADHLRKDMAKMMATKDAAAAAFATEKTQLHKELDGLKRKVESIRANKDAAMTSCRQKDAEAAKLKSQLNGLSDSLAEQRVLCDDLRAKSSRLQDELDTVKKALGEERAQGDELRSTLGELESYSADKARQVKELKTEVQNKRGQIYALDGEVKKLQLAVADAEERGKSGKVWTWLCPTTTVIAAASFAYAARSR
jgi:chromosome segregation ATPase